MPDAPTPIQEAVAWLRQDAEQQARWARNFVDAGLGAREYVAKHDAHTLWADAIEAQGREIDRLRTALTIVRNTIESDPDNLNSRSIADTIWISPIETMVDYVDAVLTTADRDAALATTHLPEPRP